MQTYMTNADDASSIIVSIKKFESLLKSSLADQDDSPVSHGYIELPKPFEEMPQIEEMPAIAECQTEQSKVDFDISSTNQSHCEVKLIKYE
jgi:hypothetical protein